MKQIFVKYPGHFRPGFAAFSLTVLACCCVQSLQAKQPLPQPEGNPFRPEGGKPPAPQNQSDPFSPGYDANAPQPAEKNRDPFAPGGAGSQAPVVDIPFVALVEHVLVPAKVLDPWLAAHPMNGDATGLRQEVENWLNDGRATLDHTALVCGDGGKTSTSESILELMYATEYEPAFRGEWPRPASFSTRNMGYTLQTGVGALGGSGPYLSAAVASTTLVGQTIWDPLMKETHKPGDVFLPSFRSVEATQADPGAKAEDPFRASQAGKMKDRNLRFSPGKIYLASRTDVDLIHPEAAPQRLIFFRGALVRPEAAPKPAKEEGAGEYQIGCRMIRVEQRIVSTWLQTQVLAGLPTTLPEAVEGWLKDGKAELAGSLSGSGRSGRETAVGSLVDVIYPTEYECPEPEKQPNGKTVSQFANATSFETRNTGNSLSCVLSAGEGKRTLHASVIRVNHAGNSVMHRILRDGEWKENITMPKFVSTRLEADLEVDQGKWQVVGIGGSFLENGDPDPQHCLIALVKVE